VAVLRVRDRKSGREAKRLATKLHKVNPSRRAKNWVKDSAAEARKPGTESKKRSLPRAIEVTGKKSKRLRTSKTHSNSSLRTDSTMPDSTRNPALVGPSVRADKAIMCDEAFSQRHRLRTVSIYL